MVRSLLPCPACSRLVWVEGEGGYICGSVHSATTRSGGGCAAEVEAGMAEGNVCVLELKWPQGAAEDVEGSRMRWRGC